jgi:hypothetical protein
VSAACAGQPETAAAELSEGLLHLTFGRKSLTEPKHSGMDAPVRLIIVCRLYEAGNTSRTPGRKLLLL